MRAPATPPRRLPVLPLPDPVTHTHTHTWHPGPHAPAWGACHLGQSRGGGPSLCVDGCGGGPAAPPRARGRERGAGVCMSHALQNCGEGGAPLSTPGAKQPIFVGERVLFSLTRSGFLFCGEFSPPSEHLPARKMSDSDMSDDWVPQAKPKVRETEREGEGGQLRSARARPHAPAALSACARALVLLSRVHIHTHAGCMHADGWAPGACAGLLCAVHCAPHAPLRARARAPAANHPFSLPPTHRLAPPPSPPPPAPKPRPLLSSPPLCARRPRPTRRPPRRLVGARRPAPLPPNHRPKPRKPSKTSTKRRPNSNTSCCAPTRMSGPPSARRRACGCGTRPRRTALAAA